MSALPPSLGMLDRQLTELSLNDNELTMLPRELGRLSKLKKLTTGGNPLLIPPIQVGAGGGQTSSGVGFTAKDPKLA